MTVEITGAPSTARISLRGGAALRAASSRAFSSSAVGSRRGPPPGPPARPPPRPPRAGAAPAVAPAAAAFSCSSLRASNSFRRSSARRARSSSVRSAVVAAEIRDAQPELVLAIDREREVPVHRAAKGIRQVDTRVPFGTTVVTHPANAGSSTGSGASASAALSRRTPPGARSSSAACMYFSISIGDTDSTSPLLSKP